MPPAALHVPAHARQVSPELRAAAEHGPARQQLSAVALNIVKWAGPRWGWGGEGATEWCVAVGIVKWGRGGF